MKIRCEYKKLVPLAELNPHPKNRNKHSADQIARLAQIFEYQGVRHPIIVSNLSGFIVAGHGRLEAARKAKMEEYPVDFQDFADEESEYAFLVSDNAVALWAELDLSGINADIGDLGPDFDLDLLGIKNFTVEVAEKEGLCDEDEVPEHVEPKTKIGDIYQLGRHRLMCGNSTDAYDVGLLMGDIKAEMTFTSPPYNLGVSAQLRGNTEIGKRKNAYESYDDNSSQEEWLSLCGSATANALKFSRYVFWNVQSLAGNRIALWKWAAAFSGNFCDIMIWDKQHAQPAAAERVVNSRFEFVWVFTSDDNPNRAIRIAPAFRGTIDNVYEGNPQRKNEFSGTHGATFPVEFPEWFISRFTEPDANVIDFFGGCGTTMIAAENIGRSAYLMEIDPKYCDVIVARWEKYTGRKAELLNS